MCLYTIVNSHDNNVHMNLIDKNKSNILRKKNNSSLDLYSFTQMQIKLVNLTICASLAAIGFATPAPGVEIAHSAFDANGAPGDINEGAGAIYLDDFADMQDEGSIPETAETLLRRSFSFSLAYIACKRIRPRLVKHSSSLKKAHNVRI